VYSAVCNGQKGDRRGAEKGVVGEEGRKDTSGAHRSFEHKDLPKVSEGKKGVRGSYLKLISQISSL